MSQFILREALPGEACLAAHFYYKLFERQFDFLPCTEQYFLHAAAELYDDDANKLWLAEENGKITGTICAVKKGPGEAQLRLFGTDPSAQGKGLGKTLLKQAMDYCAEQQLHHIILWTIDICEAAVHLYAKAGFRRTETKPNTTWANYPMTEEKWEWFAS